MRKRGIIILALTLFILITFLNVRRLEAFTLITAYEAYELIRNGAATLVDVRTLEEYVFVGSPALEPEGDPIAYLIPWEFLKGTDENGNVIYQKNPNFDALFEQTFGHDKNQALIIICRSGNRSSFAASRLEELGFTNIYEVDNKLKELASFPGGRGGVQGSSYKGLYNGYRGYPERLSSVLQPTLHKVENLSNDIDDENDSVAWMDMGLPITQRIDPDKIPKLKKEGGINSSCQRSHTNAPFMDYQTLPNYMPPTYFMRSYQVPLYHVTLMGSNWMPSVFSLTLAQNHYPVNPGISYNAFIPGIRALKSFHSSSSSISQTEKSGYGG